MRSVFRLFSFRLWFTLLLPLTPLSAARAQTVADIASRGACSTAGVEAISTQLAEAQRCLVPDGFVRFAPARGITLESARVHPYAQASAASAIVAASASVPLSINSAFRTLADQYVLYHSGGCGLAARPGRSNHQSGRAVDVQNYAEARAALTAAGCTWFGSSDPVHFDCPGMDLRSDSIRAFQRLWNRNHPEDTIAEDGLYGAQTEARLGESPASGFAVSGCDSMECVARCDGDGFIDTACARQRCLEGEVCDPDGAPGCAPPVGNPGGSMIGILFADTGSAETSVRLADGDIEILETGAHLTSGDDGVFRVDVPAGVYTIVGRVDGFAEAERTCMVEDRMEPTWCSLGLRPAIVDEGFVRGVVFDLAQGTRARVVAASVRVLGLSAVTPVDAADGSFAFAVPPGEIALEATGPGFAPTLVSCTVLPGDTSWCSIGVRATAPGSLESVFNDDPIPGAQPGVGSSGCAVSQVGRWRALGGEPSTAWLALVAVGWLVRRRKRLAGPISPR